MIDPCGDSGWRLVTKSVRLNCFKHYTVVIECAQTVSIGIVQVASVGADYQRRGTLRRQWSALDTLESRQWWLNKNEISSRFSAKGSCSRDLLWAPISDWFSFLPTGCEYGCPVICYALKPASQDRIARPRSLSNGSLSAHLDASDGLSDEKNSIQFNNYSATTGNSKWT